MRGSLGPGLSFYDVITLQRGSHLVLQVGISSNNQNFAYQGFIQDLLLLVGWGGGGGTVTQACFET